MNRNQTLHLHIKISNRNQTEKVILFKCVDSKLNWPHFHRKKPSSFSAQSEYVVFGRKNYVSLLVLLVLHHIWKKSRVLRGTWSGTNMCSSGLRYRQVLVKVLFSSSSSPQEPGEETGSGDQTGPQRSGVTTSVGLRAFFFSTVGLTWNMSWAQESIPKWEMQAIHVENHDIHYVRDRNAIYTII